LDVRTTADAAVAAGALISALLAYAAGRAHAGSRAVIAGLARAMSVPRPRQAGVRAGSAVLAASPAGVGGDLVDIFELDARFVLILVADVCGKGVTAAAHTAFITYTIRALALAGDGDPAVILATFNAMYPRTVRDPEAFVVMILGIVDGQTGSVRYASAGHEPALLRRAGGAITLLPPTGPIIGAAPLSSYAAADVQLEPGDLLVWTSDGLTESRDLGRRLLGIDGLTAWVAQAPPDPQAAADWLVAALRRRSAVLNDDVAVLTMRWDPALSPVQPAGSMADSPAER